MNRISKTIALVEKKGFACLFLGAVAAFSIGVIEYTVAILLESLIGILGFSASERSIWGLKIDLEIICISLVFIAFVRSAAFFTSNICAIYSREHLNRNLKLSLTGRILGLRRIGGSWVHAYFADVFPRASSFIYSLTYACTIGIQVLIILLAMFYHAWRESLLALGLLISSGIIIHYLNKKIYRYSESLIDIQKKTSYLVNNIIKNFIFIKVSNTEESEYSSVKERLDDYKRKYVKANELIGLSAVLPSLFGIVLISVIIFLSVKVFNTTGSKLIPFLYLFIRFVQNTSTLTNTVSQVVSAFPSFKEALNIFEPIPKKYLVTRTTSASNFKTTPPEIKIKNLSMSFDLSPIKNLQSLDLRFKAGGKYGIVGESGSGKSTLLGLILGLIDPTKGEVYIDEQDPLTYLSENSNSIGYVGPESFLVRDTVRNNLLYGISKTISEEEIWEKLELVGLREKIKCLEGHLNYEIREDSSEFSTGEKQRLCIARALLKRPALLILDEATANLDTETESRINKLILAVKECTVLVVSHRKGFLTGFNDVVSLS